MKVETRQGCCSIVTVPTFERFLSCVSVDMISQGGSVATFLPTVIALKFAHIGIVCKDVSSQFCARLEALETIRALEASF